MLVCLEKVFSMHFSPTEAADSQPAPICCFALMMWGRHRKATTFLLGHEFFTICSQNHSWRRFCSVVARVDYTVKIKSDGISEERTNYGNQ